MIKECAIVDIETWRDFFKCLPLDVLEKNTGHKFTKEEREGAVKALDVILNRGVE